MPKKKPGMTPEEQSERFKKEVQRLVDAGELNRIEAEAKLDALVTKRAVRSVKDESE